LGITDTLGSKLQGVHERGAIPKYLNNIVEQDHRRVKRLLRSGLGVGAQSGGARGSGALE
jgi:transposase-like protein